MKVRITLIAFDSKQRLKQAIIHTSAGTLTVTWVKRDSDPAWFSSGPVEARRLAIEAIQRIERIAAML